MEKAIQFGAGNIGRGFIGLLLEKSGYNVVFADVNNDIIDKINSDKCYSVNVMDIKCTKEVVKNISAINSNDERLIDEMASAPIITTAVGLTVLPKIAPLIAKSIYKRIECGKDDYVNIIACENTIKASSQLKDEVYNILDSKSLEYTKKYVGFVDCSVDRIVPPVVSENIIDVIVESFYEWNVEKSQFKGSIPKIEGMNVVDNLTSYIERKLFTLNTGHAITSYIGYLKGYKTVDESINDEKIYEIVKSAMEESGNALIKKHNFDRDEHLKYIDKIIGRFKNHHIKDDVSRVSREPIRKLSPNDRLVKPLVMAYEYNLPFENIVIGIAAALRYHNDADSQSVELQNMIKDKGINVTFSEISHIKDDILLQKVQNAYDEIKNLI